MKNIVTNKTKYMFKNLEKFISLRGKTLKTDDIAFVRNMITEGIQYFEQFDYESSDEYVLLKWGGLKSIKMESEASQKLLKEFNGIGVSASAMLQKNTDRQKEIICELIDLCAGLIQEDWGGKCLTKEEAKKYVLEYDV